MNTIKYTYIIILCELYNKKMNVVIGIVIRSFKSIYLQTQYHTVHQILLV